MLKFLILTLLSAVSFADSNATDNYLALTSQLLEHRVIDDEHLLRMIEGAEKGQAVNPISAQEGQVNVQRLLARQAYERILKHQIDVSQIAPWAKARLSQETREREEKKRKREETALPWTEPKGRIYVAGLNRCIITSQKKLDCSRNSPDLPRIQIDNVASIIRNPEISNGIYVTQTNGTIWNYQFKYPTNHAMQVNLPKDKLSELIKQHRSSDYKSDGYHCSLLENKLSCFDKDMMPLKKMPEVLQNVADFAFGIGCVCVLFKNDTDKCFYEYNVMM